MSNLPTPEGEKLFYTIGQVSQLLGLKPYILRYWETEFKVLKPQKSVTGQRMYRKKDIEAALTIKRLLYDEKYTIAGATKRLEELEKGGFDQLDLFLAANPPQGILLEPELKEEPAVSNDFLPQANPETLEKVSELKTLLQKSFEILKKYELA